MGKSADFVTMLNQIVEAVTGDAGVKKSYVDKGEYKEGMTAIFESLAAHALQNLMRCKENPLSAGSKEEEEHSQKAVYFLKEWQNTFDFEDAKSQNPLSMEYKWLLEGYYYLATGDLKKSEDSFRNVEKSATRTKGKEPFLFGAVIGVGTLAYMDGKYQNALEYFTKAIQNHHGCDASVRVAVAACCFKLQQYEKSRKATEYAISMDQKNVDAWCMLALLEMAAAVHEPNHRKEHNLLAHEYWLVALSLDPLCPQALIHQAEYYFRTWNKAGDCKFLNDTTVTLNSDSAKEVNVGDQMQFEGVAELNSVKEIMNSADNNDEVIIVLSQSNPDMVGKTVPLQFKKLAKTLQYAFEANKQTTNKQIIAEGFYIQGKVYHTQNNIEQAAKCYKLSIKESPMDLSAFNLGKIYLYRAINTGTNSDYEEALKLFGSVANRNPKDKETKAYLLLLNALYKNEAATYENIKDVVKGFPHEIDLWLVQGQLRTTKKTSSESLKQSEYNTALKCYLAAFEGLKERKSDSNMISSVLTNIAVLQLSLGRATAALEYIKLSLQQAQHVPAPLDEDDNAFVNPVFENFQFNGVFFSWTENPIASVKKGKDANSFMLTDKADMAALNIYVGEQIIIDDVIHVIESQTKTGFVAYSPVDVFAIGASRDGGEAALPVRRKVLGHNFNNQTITHCYNFARILEETGQSVAAKELYLALIEKNISFSEAYLRMSHISMDLGDRNGAIKWIRRVLQIDSNHPDALTILGDLYYREKKYAEANLVYTDLRESYEKDPRPMVSLGNIHFASKDGGKNAYKFYHAVLKSEPANVFACNGLGMVCVEKNEFGVAREIFSRARETNINSSDDVTTNLAHVNMIEGRMAEAEHFYQIHLKSKIKAIHQPPSGEYASTYECMAFAQFKNGRHEEAIRSLLRGLHQEPWGKSENGEYRFEYNIAYVRAQLATQLFKRGSNSSSKLIRNAISELKIAGETFRFLSELPESKQKDIAPEQLQKFLSTYEKSILDYENELVLVEEAEVNRESRMTGQREELQERQRRKQEEKEIELEKENMKKIEQNKVLAEKQKKLKELNEKWVGEKISTNTGPKKGASKKKGMERVDSDDDLLASSGIANGVYASDSDDMDGGLLSKKSKSSGKDNKDLFGESDSDTDDEIFSSKRKKAAVIANDDDEDDDAGNAKRSKPEEAEGDSAAPVNTNDDDDDEDIFGE